MGSAVTQALVTKMGGKGKIIMTQGALGHTGAQGRAKGFEMVVKQYPGIEVLDTQPADWDVSKTARLWETYLTKYPQIDAAFFHNDDMALAAYNIMKAHNRTNILIGGVDAMPPAIARSPTGACSPRCAIRPAASMAAPSSPAWRRSRRREDRHGHSQERRHGRPGRHQGKRRRHAVDGRSLPDLSNVALHVASSSRDEALDADGAASLPLGTVCRLSAWPGGARSHPSRRALLASSGEVVQAIDGLRLRRRLPKCTASPSPSAASRRCATSTSCCARGEIHGLVGENGAGKSTLMKIIAGLHAQYQGRMAIDGTRVHFRSARDALAAGIGMVHQELSIVPDLTVAENVYLGKQPTRLGFIDWRAMSPAPASISRASASTSIRAPAWARWRSACSS